MQMIGQRIVDGVDIRDRRAAPRTSHRLWECPELTRGLLRLGQIARGDGRDFGPLAALHGGNHFDDGDIGDAENAPTKFTHVIRFPACSAGGNVYFTCVV